jgi:hypothetical protein
MGALEVQTHRRVIVQVTVMKVSELVHSLNDSNLIVAKMNTEEPITLNVTPSVTPRHSKLVISIKASIEFLYHLYS